VLREAPPGEERISVNISARSLEQPRFVAWLARELGRDRGLAARLTFEVAEYGVARNEAAAAEFVRIVNRAGAAFAIDHFGIHRDCLALLQRLHPAYVKLAGVQVRRAVADAGAHFFAESLVRAARQLDIPVIAQHVEDDAIYQAIAAIDFAGYQGNLDGGPRPWPPPSRG
jgi:EAL domain-containing protein (putative c-di-GMP-specific phosphodiesterase class I)